jgi:hypothetical protein
MTAEEPTNSTQGPGIGLLTPDRMPDWGPRYTETPPDPYAPDAPRIAEPWNTVTASFFIVIVAFWVWRLRGRFSQYPFLCCCLPILLVGGIGGALYHATRVSISYFLLDVVPIQFLGLAGSIYLVIRVGYHAGWKRQVLFGGGAVIVLLLVNFILFPTLQTTSLGGNPNLRVNLSYATLAIIVVLPMVAMLIRTRFRHVGWVVSGLLSFVIAWFFRLFDLKLGLDLPMGSHWLWHTFGAITTAMIFEYFYHVEGEAIEATAPSPP